MKIKCLCVLTIIIRSCLANKPLSTTTPSEMLQAAVVFLVWISVISFFLNLDFFRTEDLSAAYEHHIPNEREKKALLYGIFRFVVPMRHCTGRRSKVTDSQFDGAQNSSELPNHKSPEGGTSFSCKNMLFWTFFVFVAPCCRHWKLVKKNQDHARHIVRLDPS